MGEAEASTAPLVSAGPGLWLVDGLLYREAADEELPASFEDPGLGLFRVACTNGFTGDVSVMSAFLHNPHRWPQCFPQGEGSHCCCRTLLLRRVEELSAA